MMLTMLGCCAVLGTVRHRAGKVGPVFNTSELAIFKSPKEMLGGFGDIVRGRPWGAAVRHACADLVDAGVALHARTEGALVKLAAMGCRRAVAIVLRFPLLP